MRPFFSIIAVTTLQSNEFSGCATLEQRVPQDHPWRATRKLTDTVLQSLSAGFYTLYSSSGRFLIAPEYVLRALLLLLRKMDSHPQLPCA
jgi:hypothetical protein